MGNIKAMMSSADMTWETPRDFFEALNNEFHFTLDPYATIETAKCKKFYTKKNNKLSKN